MPIILWYRQDLRINDNPALFNALNTGLPVIPVYILDDDGEKEWKLGEASRWRLHHSLASLNNSLEKKGLSLLFFKGDSEIIIAKLFSVLKAKGIYWNRRYEPHILERDARIKTQFKDEGFQVKSFNGSLLFEPWENVKADNTPYLVYSPFYKNNSRKTFQRELFTVKNEMLLSSEQFIKSAREEIKKSPSLQAYYIDDLNNLKLTPKIPWDKDFYELWRPGEDEARECSQRFLKTVDTYSDSRNIPSILGTSRLSSSLHFGEISPHQIYTDIQTKLQPVKKSEVNGAEVYFKELFWREFGYHLLFHFPKTPFHPLRAEYEKFPWRDKAEYQNDFTIWKKGMTGYPIVDAGMRELWTTGWMHNRVRMITASFLVKNLLIPWQEGARWFWDTLVDADLASNTLGWQWTAGCGADAAPYFRVFNPVLQGEKFDPEGLYVKKWIPELSEVSLKYIHKPWEANGGKSVGEYPPPCVDLSETRDRALRAFSELKKKKN
jgi:deoxyribodipyrimidine photo-lyase